MLVISDTSPITNLIQIGKLDLLRQMFGQVIIPQTVYKELCEIPEQYLAISNETWITVQEAREQNFIASLQTELDHGEAEAIALALELKADFLIIDELKGRSKAEALGLRIVGLLGILIQAKQAEYIKAVQPLLIELRKKAGFHIHQLLYERVLQLAGEAV